MSKYIVYPGNNSKLFIIPALEGRGSWEEGTNYEHSTLRANFIWSPIAFPISTYAKLDALHNASFGIQIHNHLENNRFITTKPGLVRALKQFYVETEEAVHANLTVHDVIATSFILTAQVEDLEFRQFVARYYEIKAGNFSKERIPAKHCRKNMWLLKPAALNQGRGIEVCRTLQEIKDSLRNKPANTTWVLQKYIEKPLLIDNRKFDIRIWGLATASYEFYYYRKGYLRTSSSAYDTDGKDTYIHLTNNCLQKYGTNYGLFEKGNTLSFEEFQDFLDQEYPFIKVDFWQHIVPRIKDIMIDTYKSSMQHLQKGKRNLSFELLGYDFLIDEDFRVWLIEVNTNPYLGTPNEYMEGLVPEMIDDLLAITVDPHVPPECPRNKNTNDFELLFKRSSKFTSRNPYNFPVYPFSHLAQNNASAANYNNDEDTPKSDYKTAPKDVQGQIKDLIESTLAVDMHDFSKVTNRALTQLQNWEIYSEDQIKACLEGLKMLMNHVGGSFLLKYNFCKQLFALSTSENIPVLMQESLIEIMKTGFLETKFRKEMVIMGICSFLIRTIEGNLSEKPVQKAAVDALITLSTHPARKVYIPGETREHNFIRKQLILKGLMVCLMQLRESEHKKTIKLHLKVEFNYYDWENFFNAISECLEDPVASQFPDTYKDKNLLKKIQDEIAPVLRKQREEMQERKNKDLMKQNEVALEAMNIEREKSRLREERNRRVTEFANKRFQELQMQKNKESVKIDKVSESPEQRKLIIMEKAKKLERERILNRLKLKKEAELHKRKQEEMIARHQEIKEKAVQEWLKNKLLQEKDRKMLERTQEIEKQKALEYHIFLKKIEIEKKLAEKRKAREKLGQSESEIKIRPNENYEKKLTSTNFVNVTPSSRKLNLRPSFYRKNDLSDKFIEGIRNGLLPGKPYLETQELKKLKLLS